MDIIDEIKEIFPDKNKNPLLQLLAKNDDHMESMHADPAFIQAVQERNEQANIMMNLSNPELTRAGDNAAQNATVLVANTNEGWLNNQWRPAVGWAYLAICICDFILFPIGWSILQAAHAGSVTTPWQPLTLQGAGLIHLSMGAIIGVTSYGRTQEKIASK